MCNKNNNKIGSFVYDEKTLLNEVNMIKHLVILNLNFFNNFNFKKLGFN